MTCLTPYDRYAHPPVHRMRKWMVLCRPDRWALVAVLMVALEGFAQDQPTPTIPEKSPPSAAPLETPANAADSATPAATDATSSQLSDYELMKLFVDTLDEVERNYVRPIDRRELMEAAIQGVLGKLDEYSDYIAPTDIDRFKREVENEFGGIGIRVALERDQLTIIAPMEGTPAHDAGLLSGDTIVSIDGQPAAGMEIEEVVRRLRGRIGTEVTLRIRSEAAAEPREVVLKRAEIHVETVLGYARVEGEKWSYWCDREQGIGYARITSFNAYTAADLNRHVRALQSDGMRALVLDLRFNPGGLLDAAIEVSDLFLKEGRIVSTKGRNVEERVWDAKAEGTIDDFPMAILVNHFSASASEIVSASLQDHQRAVIVGDRTWGKGSVQRLIDLEQGRSALKLTTASYYRPSGKNIHRSPDATEEDEWGVQPDDGLKLELTAAEMRQLIEFQQEQVLGGLTPGQPQEQPSNDPPDDQPSDGNAEGKRTSFVDPQLKLATDRLLQALTPK